MVKRTALLKHFLFLGIRRVRGSKKQTVRIATFELMRILHQRFDIADTIKTYATSPDVRIDAKRLQGTIPTRAASNNTYPLWVNERSFCEMGDATRGIGDVADAPFGVESVAVSASVAGGAGVVGS